MKVEGGCHCGAIAYEAEVNPDTVSICHCADCQVLSGAPYRASAPVKGETLKFTKGTPKTYEKVAESGNRRSQGFCADCGSAIYSTSIEPNPAIYMMRVGGIKQRDQLVPKREIWTRSAQPWTAHLDALESFETNPPPPKK